MDLLFKLLNLNTSCDNVPIIVNNGQDINGYGITFGNYVLTLFHVIEDTHIIKINNIQYYSILNIDEYDIAILIKESNNNSINDFLIEFKEFIDNLVIKIDSIERYKDDIFNFNKNKLKFNEIRHIHPRTNLLPSIPMYVFNTLHDTLHDTLNNTLQNKDYGGYSGHSINYYNMYTCLIGFERIETGEIVGLPFQIIYQIVKSYLLNNMKFYHLPIIVNDNSCIIHGFRNIVKNDIIIKINDIDVLNNILIDPILNIEMSYDTYILLNGFTNLNIKLYKIYNKLDYKSKKENIINIRLKEFNYSNLFLNYKQLDIKNQKINFIEFEELSEQYLIDCMNNSIKVIDVNYNEIYCNNKLIYIKKIYNMELLELFKKNGFNFESELYILNKVSGKKIKKIEDLNQYNQYKSLTIDFLDSNNNNIKIKI